MSKGKHFLFCIKCGYSWRSRVPNPVECPACKTRNYIPKPDIAEKMKYPAMETRKKLYFRAEAAVRVAVKRGILPKLDGSIPCVDCGKPATGYDHRDYFKKLEVEPVCGGCNVRRGPGNLNPDLSK